MEQLDFSGNPPAERVQTYLARLDEHNEHSSMQYGDTIHSFNFDELTRTDLRDVLRELHNASSELDASQKIIARLIDALVGAGVSRELVDALVSDSM